MYGKLFNADKAYLCYEISSKAALCYASLIYNADVLGENAPIISSLSVALGLDYKKEVLSLVKELEEAGLIESYKQPMPIGQLQNGNLIMGNVHCARILNYETPDRQERLSPSAWSALRTQAFERDDFTCAYCDKRGVTLECDHLIPISKGGTNELGNLVTACVQCNRSKRDKLITEWRAGS